MYALLKNDDYEKREVKTSFWAVLIVVEGPENRKYKATLP